MVKRITAEAGEKCEVDVGILHETLLDFPADKYLELYHMMQTEIIQPFCTRCAPLKIGEVEKE